MNHENNPNQAIPYFEELYQTYDRNPYYARQLVRVLVNADKDEEALAAIDKVLARQEMPYEAVVREELLAWKGYIHFTRDELEDAEKLLRTSYVRATADDLPQGINRPFHVMSGYYLGRIYEERANTATAINYYRSIEDSEPATHYSEEARTRAEKLDSK
jgi:tetratricopeptide (TPR) repeat protein